MIKLFAYFDKKQRVCIVLALILVTGQVWLDLKLPDYMSAITTLVETAGSSMSDILKQGIYMLLCAVGSMLLSVIVGYIAAIVAAGLAKTLRGEVFDKTLSFSMAEMNRFSTASLINRTTNDITQVQTFVSRGLQAIIKAPILAVWAVIKISSRGIWWTLVVLSAFAAFRFGRGVFFHDLGMADVVVVRAAGKQAYDSK